MNNLFSPAKKVVMSLVGLDGNTFSLMGAFSACARIQGWTKDEISVVTNACMSGDYDNLLQVLIEHTDDDIMEDTTEGDIGMEEDGDDPMGDYGYRD